MNIPLRIMIVLMLIRWQGLRVGVGVGGKNQGARYLCAGSNFLYKLISVVPDGDDLNSTLFFMLACPSSAIVVSLLVFRST